MPDFGALGVPWNTLLALEYSYRKLFWINAQLLCKELIAPGNHLFLKVVAQGPVSQHLEACQMMRVAYAVYIAGADTLLVIGKPSSCRVRLPQDIWYQRMHSRGGEKYGRIIFRNDRCTGNLCVSLGYKKIDEFFSKFVSFQWFHGSLQKKL